MQFCYTTASIKKLEKTKEDHKAIRADLCGIYEKDLDPEFAYGDNCQFETEETLEYAARKGVHVLTLEPVAAYRTKYTWSKSSLQFDSFLKYMQLCGVSRVIVPNAEMKRIAECIMSLDRGGATFDHVTTYVDEKMQGFPLEKMK